MNEEYEEDFYEEQDQIPVASPPPTVGQWSWSTDKLLKVAAVVAVTGFGVWFLMAFTGARARAIAEGVSGGE
jgi:hypothetical protein